MHSATRTLTCGAIAVVCALAGVPSFAADRSAAPGQLYARVGLSDDAERLSEADMDLRRGGSAFSDALATLLGALPEENTTSATINGGGTVTSSGDGPQTFSFTSPTTSVELSAGPSAAPPSFPSFTRVISTTSTRTRSRTFTIVH